MIIPDIENNISIKLYSGTTEIFYSSIERLKSGEWIIIDNQALTHDELNKFQYHNIGGNLFKGDEYIRALTIEELKNTPKMLIAGFEAIEIYLNIAFTNKSCT